MRLQLALDVTDLDAAVKFYTALFDTAPAKQAPGYANFAIDQPPLKLVLFAGSSDATINHLGVEVDEADEVHVAARRLAAAGLAPTTVTEATCCHADKLETWVDGPDGTHWEWYLKVADVVPDAATADTSEAGCCRPTA